MKGRKKTTSARPKVAAHIGPCALMVVDNAPFRRQLKKDYEKAARELDRARAELQRFEEEDVPQYSRWFNQQFGALLTEARETSARIQELENKLWQMETDVFFGASPGRAYQRMMNRNAEPEPEPEAEQADESERNYFHSSNDEPFGDWSPPSKRTKKKAPITNRLRELYRAVVRRLHPDKKGKVNAKELEWWHQAQEAYAKGDIEQLEVILALCEIDDTGNSDKTSFSTLRRIIQQLKSNLRAIGRELSRCRKQPAWNFARRKDLAALAKSIKNQLMHELRGLREELLIMEEQMARWADTASRKRVYRRRRVDPFEMLF